MIYGENAAEEVEKIFDRVDIDGSGQIDYSEWVVATIDKSKLLTREKLQSAFNLFDKDGGGSISAQEVKEVFCSGQDYEEELWDKITAEIDFVDTNGNGEIDFDEFATMMQKLIYENEEEMMEDE
jgi:calcium-dependent protein kinase